MDGRKIFEQVTSSNIDAICFRMSGIAVPTVPSSAGFSCLMLFPLMPASTCFFQVASSSPGHRSPSSADPIDPRSLNKNDEHSLLKTTQQVIFTILSVYSGPGHDLQHPGTNDRLLLKHR